MFTSLWNWLTSKLSLVLGYVSIGIAIVLGCAAIWFYHQNVDLHSSVTNLKDTTQTLAQRADQAEANVQQQKKALDDLVAVRAKDATVMNGLVQAIGGISKDIHTTKNALQQLKEHSDEAKSYLNTPLPASVRSVLTANGKVATGSHPGSGSSGQGDSAGNAAPAGSSTSGSQDQHQ